jgi:hypothetical protein
MAGAPHATDDDRRGCVLLGNWVLIGLGVACVAFHVGTAASLTDAGAVAEGWPRFGVLLLAIPSVLIGATLAIASASRRVVPRPIRRVELTLVVLIVAGMAFEFVTAF